MSEYSSVRRVVIGSIGVLVAVLAGTVAKEGVRSAVRSPNATSVTRSVIPLARIASKVNEGLPMMVDKETELMNVGALPGVLVYNYRLINAMHSELTADDILTLKPQVSASACSTPATRDGVLKNDITMRYSYVDKDRNYIGSFDITKSACSLPR